MLDILKLCDERKSEMMKFFKQFEVANEMEPTQSQMKELPGAYLMPLTCDPRGTTYNSIEDQAKDEVFGILILAKMEDLSKARQHVNDVFRGYVPHPQEVNIPFHPIMYVGGEIRNIKANTYAWMDMYKTYTLGGC